MGGQQTEVALKLNGMDLFNYYTDRVPQKGELVELEYEEIEGTYQVNRVTNVIFQDKQDEIMSFVTVDLIEHIM